MTAVLWEAARVVHRYCGRQHGGHCEVASTGPLAKAIEPLVHRRSDLAGEDLGRPVPPYFSGYPLPDGRYAFARTRYLEDADCLGAVRTESLLLTPEQQAELVHPLLLREAFDEPADLGAELEAVRAARGPHDVAPRDLGAVVDGAPRDPDFSPLLALDDAKLEPLLHAWCGSLPVAIVGGTPELLGALLALAPDPWSLGICTQALSHRDWARLQAVPPEAAERFVLRAAREKDVAVVDLVGRALQGVVTSPLASWIHTRLRAGELGPLLSLVARAREVEAYAAPSDLAAQQRFEALSSKPLSSEEVIEHVNHLKVRGAAPEELAAAFTPLLAGAEPGRAGFTLNVLRSGWLPTEPEPAAEPAVGALLEQAAAEGAGRALLAFLEAGGERFPAARARGLCAVARRLSQPEPWEEREDAAWRELALAALPYAPEEVSAALAERAPWLDERGFERALGAARALESPSDATWLHLVDAAAATGAGPFAAAVRAAAKRAQLRRELGLRVAAFSPQDPSLIGELSAEWAYEELGSLLRGLSPAAWSTAAEVLRERVDTLGKWDAGGGRALARLAALGRGDPTREGLARAHGLRLLRVSGARARLLELARLKAAAGARELLLAVLDALQAPDPPPPEEHDAWRAITLALTLPLDDALATRLPRPAWGVELATLARLAPPPPLPEGPLAERMRAAAEQAAAALIASPGGAEPACVPWLAQALEHATDSADHWAPAVAALARELEPGPIHERLRASALSRRDTFGPEALVALRELVSALPAPELAQQLLDLELRFALLPPVERGDTPAPTAAAWRALLALASAAQGPAALWTRVGAAVSAGDVALEALEELGALPLAHALDGLSGGFSLRIQNELQQLVLRLAAGDDPDRLAVTVRAVIARSQGDRELRQRLGAQLQAALEQAPGLRTPSVFEALRALLK